MSLSIAATPDIRVEIDAESSRKCAHCLSKTKKIDETRQALNQALRLSSLLIDELKRTETLARPFLPRDLDYDASADKCEQSFDSK